MPYSLLWTGFCLGMLTVGPAWAQQARPAERQKKNILVIVLDDLGTDKLAMYGETPPTCPPSSCLLPPNCLPSTTGCVGPYPSTPNLDELRGQGILFTHAYATPVCSSTRAWIQTGRYGFRTGIGRATNTVNIPGDFGLSNDETFLAELVRDGIPSRGAKVPGLPYQCGAFGKWHLTTTLAQDRSHAVENGYQRFAGTMGNIGNYFRYSKVVQDAGSAPTLEKINGIVTTPPYTVDTWHGSVTRRDALEWIRAQTNSFLAYVAFSPPHAPIQVPPFELLPPETQCNLSCAGLAPGDFLSQSSDPPALLRLVHNALTEALDTEIGNLIHGMDAAQRANTMIFVVGDNGTVGFVVDDPPHDADRAKGQVYELGIRVPMIVCGPMVPRPVPGGGWTSNALVSLVDLWSTIADISGANANKFVASSELDSVSFLSVIRDPLSSGHRTSIFSQFFSPNGVLTVAPPSCYEENQRSMSDGVYKYIRTQTSLSASPCGTPSYHEELYDISIDPEEATNLLLGSPTPEANTAKAALSAEMDALSGL